MLTIFSINLYFKILLLTSIILNSCEPASFLDKFAGTYGDPIVITNNDNYAIKLSNNAVNVLMDLETLFTQEKITLKDYNKFMNSFNRYINFFRYFVFNFQSGQ